MSPELEHLPVLLERVRRTASRYGAKSELARFLGVSQQAVSSYLRGKSLPGAEVALRMLQWVTACEDQSKKDARGVAAPLARKAQARKSQSNEKPNSGQAET